MDIASQELKEPTRKEWRSFWTLIVLQVQNAFNEKAVQILLIPLAAILVQSGKLHMGIDMEYLLGAIMVLPYILIAPSVGWLADRYCKARIIQIMTILQVIVIGSTWFFLHEVQSIHAAIWLFCIFAIQATVLSPARKGIVKDMIGSKYLGFASGIVEMSIVFALLVAQIAPLIWFDHLLREGGNPWYAAAFPTMCFGLAAIPVAIFAFVLPRYPVGQTKPFSMKLFFEHFIQLKYLMKHRDLRLSEIGIAYFWFLAGVITLMAIQIAKENTGGGAGMGTETALLVAWLSGGVTVGGVLASIVCRKGIELGLIPLGAIGMTLGCVFAACFPPASVYSHIGFTIIGFFASSYLVPLNAYLQDKCDPAQRGNVIAAGNLMDMIWGLIAVFFQMIMKEVCPIQGQFVILAILSLGITIVALRLIPREFVRMLGLWLMNICYRKRIIGEKNIPSTGGALIVSNHVTYGDALFLSMISPRPIRFLVAEEFVAFKLLGWILELFDCLPISSSNPRESLSKAIHALRAGEVICIFPEGQLTRTGTLSAMRRGVELIARKSQAPIIPVYMDELWGSILSFSGNTFFKKKPKRLPAMFSAAIGEPLSPVTTTPQDIMNVLRRLSGRCLEVSSHVGADEVLNSLEKYGHKPLVICHNASLSGTQIAQCVLEKKNGAFAAPLQIWVDKLLQCLQSGDELSRSWMNAQQIERVNALQPKQMLLTNVGANEAQETVVGVLWPILTGTPLYLLTDKDKDIPQEVEQIAGGIYMRTRLRHLIPMKALPFFDFSMKPDFVVPNTNWRPSYVTDQGIVIAMSMKHSVYKVDDGTIQLGMQTRSRGRLLPGFWLQEGTTNIINSPTLSGECALANHLYVDESGFLAELQVRS